MTKQQLEAKIAELNTQVLDLNTKNKALFAELIEANRWARIFREQRDQIRGNQRRSTKIVELSGTPEERRTQLAAAKASLGLPGTRD